MKFSIIVPIYNVEQYLRKCVVSLLSQTFIDYEMILVDDGSKDGSPDICDELQKRDGRIRVIHQPNAGLSMARNNGLAIAQGEYIVFIDSDDFILSNDFLQKIADKTKDGADVVFYKHSRFMDESQVLYNCNYSYNAALGETTLAGKIRKMVEADAFYGSAWIKTIKRSMMVDNGILFEKGLLGEDMEWNYHLMMHIKSLELIDESFLAYRQREGSISQTLKLKNLTDFIYVMEKWSGPIDNLEDKELRLALLGSLAKYYSNLMVVYMRVEDKKKLVYKKNIKNLSWLLSYGMSRRPRVMSRVYKIIGFDLTILFLRFLDRVKR